MMSLSLVVAMLFVLLHSLFPLDRILQWEGVLSFSEQTLFVAVCPVFFSFCIFGGAVMIQLFFKKAKKMLSVFLT
jgi:hypothetical protein